MPPSWRSQKSTSPLHPVTRHWRLKERHYGGLQGLTSWSAWAEHLLIRLGAQHTHWEEAGAYTGEVSAPMLAKLAVSHVICGHSERRQHFGETDETVNRRAKAILRNGIIPIVCVGETLDERESERTEEVVVSQLDGGLAGVKGADLEQVVIAYEPVWAIGTGRNAAPDDAGAVCELIRTRLGERAEADAIRILYGGSVNAGNIKALMAKRHIDGALVGGASLDPDGFASICRYWR